MLRTIMFAGAVEDRIRAKSPQFSRTTANSIEAENMDCAEQKMRMHRRIVQAQD